jgi:hypothetical protein
MFIRRHGRATPLRGFAGLTVCLACALAAAGPPLVRPDEAAGLSAVMRIEDREEGIEDPFGIDPVVPLSVDSSGPRTSSLGPAPHTETRSALLASHQWHPAVEATLLFEDNLPAVVRGQSPEIELLPLAGGEVSIENTSLMRWATGTKGRIRGDYLTDFDDTDRIGVQTLTQGWLGLGFDAEANYWQRPVGGLGREPLWTGDLNLIYNLVPHPRFKFRSGMGAAWTVEDGKPHAGYNVTHGLDVYLLWRAMAIGEIDWGQLDDDKLFRYRLALGLTYDSFEFFSGYESYKLGDERLDGWVNGVAWWY